MGRLNLVWRNNPDVMYTVKLCMHILPKKITKTILDLNQIIFEEDRATEKKDLMYSFRVKHTDKQTDVITLP